MLEARVGLGPGKQRDQIGLDEQIAREQMAEQLVAVVGHRADAVEQMPLPARTWEKSELSLV